MTTDQDASRQAPESFASQFEKVSGLKQWLYWLWALLIACSLVFAGYLIDAPLVGDFSYLDLGIYTVIIGLGIATIYISYRDAVFIDHQSKIASEQVNLLVELNDVAEFLETAKPSIFRSHIASLYQIFLSHSEINQDNLIEILHSRLLAKNKVVALFSSILITLGLIGTIIGLILMTNDLGKVIQTAGGTDTQALMQNIAGEDGPLGSLGVAFYTTLFGAVLGGVILRILSNVVDANIMRYTAHIAELTEVNVLPFMRQLARNLEAGGFYQNLGGEGG